MRRIEESRCRFGSGRQRRFAATALVLLLSLCTAGSVAQVHEASPALRVSQTGVIPPELFSQISEQLSEQGGYFSSDNFTSNENSFPFVFDKLRDLGVSGGAYVGVGPEQNFNYIAAIRPQIAFIVDIRRQAVIQHLMYKAVFSLARNRAQFLALLFSRPLAGPKAPKANASLDALFQYFDSAETSEDVFHANLANLQKEIVETFHFTLSRDDRRALEYVYDAFWKAGDGISFRFGNNGYGNGGFPDLRELMLATDRSGRESSFLAHDDDYEFVRKLEMQNRIIPVVGDFGGSKALAGVGDFLRDNGYTVSAFYTSNVEQFLYQENEFDAYVANVRHFPVRDNSVFIRAARRNYDQYPSQFRRLVVQLEKIPVFLKDYEAGLYPNYFNLVSTHAITGDFPQVEQ